ncbi:unnamed protein product [Rotaria sordida]|uniref:Uncharacterized protein n=1 Tax=Rotaria sordida TaxID=392033 RepID=A0A815YFT1_9BILA|nr:unnamed protein product [Rotaria sordida]CAF1570180.1 unnamed protein product [Rotaria sordida]
MQCYLRLLLAFNILVGIIGSQATWNRIETTYKNLKAEVETSNRCTSSKQCAAEATGKRACGGPNGYIVYSTAKADSVRKIKWLASQTRSLETMYNRENDIVSICSMVMPPSVSCNSGKCVAIDKYKRIHSVY